MVRPVKSAILSSEHVREKCNTVMTIMTYQTYKFAAVISGTACKRYMHCHAVVNFKSHVIESPHINVIYIMTHQGMIKLIDLGHQIIWRSN